MSTWADVVYPASVAYDSGRLAVDAEHTLYYEQLGNPSGRPAVFLHGGPAAGFNERSHRFFDPAYYRIVVFDQRGAGKSTPSASLNNNDTWQLVNDIEKLRTHLNIEQWHIVFGGSWGSTLSLAYAMTHPTRVKSLVLRGIFLFHDEDMEWLFQRGVSEIFPDYWTRYIEFIPESERGNLLKAYYARLTSPDDDVRLEAARRFTEWELNVSKLHNNQAAIQEALKDVKFFEPFARAECHFFLHRGWFEPETWLLDHADRIAHIPTAIIHGRYDVVCRPRAAFELHKRLPKSTLEYTFAGHSDSETDTARALRAATDRMREIE